MEVVEVVEVHSSPREEARLAREEEEEADDQKEEVVMEEVEEEVVMEEEEVVMGGASRGRGSGGFDSLSVSICLSVFLSVRPSICPSVCLSVSLSLGMMEVGTVGSARRRGSQPLEWRPGACPARAAPAACTR